jgi:hypothetical protein
MSCEKLEDTQPQDQNKKESLALSKARVATGSAGTLVSGGRTTYESSPKIGNPNETFYLFQVHDPIYGDTKPLGIRFENLYGTVTYVPMTYNSSMKTWNLQRQLQSKGRVRWWYVYYHTDGTEMYRVQNSPIYYIDNTRVRLFGTDNSSSEAHSIYWPFGNDGSSYINRNGWISSHETNGCGYDWGLGTHVDINDAADDQFAEDWNNDCSNASSDAGKIITSPLDGEVVSAKCTGDYGCRVDIKQTIGDKILMFRVAHLKPESIPASVKRYAIITSGMKIGELGTSGNSSAPHAHCVLYQLDPVLLEKKVTAQKFVFNADN